MVEGQYRSPVNGCDITSGFHTIVSACVHRISAMFRKVAVTVGAAAEGERDAFSTRP